MSLADLYAKSVGSLVMDVDTAFGTVLYASSQVIDEARHVAFGRLALREFYPQLSTAGS